MPRARVEPPSGALDTPAPSAMIYGTVPSSLPSRRRRNPNFAASGGVRVVRRRVVRKVGVLAAVGEPVAAQSALLLVEGDRALERERPRRWRPVEQLGQAP